MTQPYAPVFLQPNPDGQLAQSHTPLFKARYMNPRGSADPAGQVLFKASRLATAGSPALTPQLIWDSSYLGGIPTVNNTPLAVRHASYVQLNNRVYQLGGIDAGGTIHAEVYSAPVYGAALGTWRQERSMAIGSGTGPANRPSPRQAMAACTATFGATGGSGSAGIGVGGTPWVLVYGGITDQSTPAAVGSMIGAPIRSDGTLGPWITLSLSTAALAYAQLTPVPNAYVTSGLILSGGVTTATGAGQTTAWATMVRNAPASANWIGDWDTPGGWWTQMTSTGFPAVAGHNMAFDWEQGRLVLFRGTNNAGGGSQTGQYTLPFGIDINNWVFTGGFSGTWSAVGVVGGGAQNVAGMVYWGANGGVGYVYLLGGTTSDTVTDVASATAAIKYGTLTWTAGVLGTVTYNTGAFPIPAATASPGAFVADYNYGAKPWTWPWPITDRQSGHIFIMGGGNGTTSALNTVYSGGCAAPENGSDIGSWDGAGTGQSLATSHMGTGGSVVATTDPTAPAGSQDVTIQYGQAPGEEAAAALNDGDLILVSVQFTDKLGGDPSPIRSSIIRIGAAPTVTNITATPTASGQPLIAWAFNGGVGGQAQATWRCVITLTAGGAVMADSGVTLGQANQFQVKVAPVLANVSHTATITVTSSDNPISGATATATGTLVFTPTTAAAPSVPTSFAVTPDASNFWDLATWTNAASTTSNRIYHRRNGVSAWTLLLEYTAGSGAQSIRLMDKIPLGVGLDFAVSAMGGTAASESALSTVVSNVVLPAPFASPAGYLHLAGQAPVGAIGAYVNAQVQPTMSAQYASKVFTRFNGSRAVVRQGPVDYRKLDVEILTTTLAAQKGLQTLVRALLAGGVAYWRGRNGGEMFPVALDSPEEVKTLWPAYRDFTLHLVEVDDIYAPYVAAGTAVGLPTLANGTIPPLDISERVA